MGFGEGRTAIRGTQRVTPGLWNPCQQLDRYLPASPTRLDSISGLLPDSDTARAYIVACERAERARSFDLLASIGRDRIGGCRRDASA